MIDIDSSSDDLHQRIDRANLVYRLENSEDWKLIREMSDRVVNDAMERLVTTSPSQVERMIELQQIVKLYRNVLPNLMSLFKQEGALAEEELRARGPTPA